MSDFLINFLAGGTSGAVAKTATAPIERVKLIIQTQDANPKIISGEVARYTGIVNCFTRISSEQGVSAFWRGNFTNIIRYFPTQAFNFAFKDGIKAMFPKANKKTEFGKFFCINVASGGLAGAGSLMIVYPLDYARTRLASDVGGKDRQFNGLADCLKKTVQAEALLLFIMVLEFLLWELFLIVVLTLVFLIHSLVTILIKMMITVSSVHHLSSFAPKLLPFQQVTFHIPSTLYDVGYKCNRRRLNMSGCTRELLTVSGKF